MKKLLFWLPAAILAGIIFYFSSIPSLQSNLPGNWDLYLRKFVHITEYILFTLAIHFAFHRGHGLETKKCLLFAALLAVLYAFSDEFHQLFVPGRQGRLRDVAIDMIGITLAICFLHFRTKSNKQIAE